MKVMGEKFVGFGVKMIGAVCVAAVFLVVLVLLAMPAEAQNGGDAAENQYGPSTPEPVTPGPDDECPGAEVVTTITGTGNQETAPFRITGERFRVTTTVAPDPGVDSDNAFVGIIVETADGDIIGTISKSGPDTESAIQNEGPGDFFLDITTASASYAIVVEDCVDTEGNPPVSPGDPEDPRGVDKSTIPNKPLPNTGGLPLVGFVMIGLALVGVGGSIVRAGMERKG